jgi:Family of unknown function (DUF6510)
MRLDGNAAAGILRQVFAVEMTEACGKAEAVGAVVVHDRAPGTVLRCPHCESVLAKFVTDGERVWVDLRGVRTLELRV